MNLFYLDTEYSHGNFYLGDIFDMTLIAAKSGHVFHTLINIPTPLNNHIQFMCNMTDGKLQREGIPFEDAFKAMIAFVNGEVDNADEISIMAHSGYLADFPLLLVNCRKNKCDIAAMNNYRFVDTLQILQNVAENNTLNSVLSVGTINKLPDSLALKTLAKEVLGLEIHQPVHNSHNDAESLMKVFECEPYKSILMTNIKDKSNTYNVNSLHEYLDFKLPLSIDQMYTLATRVRSPHQLELVMSPHVREKTSLNKKSVSNIALYYMSFKHSYY
jgi:hypothetical protein